MRPLLLRCASVFAVPALLLVGCASEGSPAAGASGTATASASGVASPSGAASPSSSASAVGVPAAAALPGIGVTGGPGQKPTITLTAKPTSLSSSGTRVITPGTGAVVTKGQKVSVDYVLLNGKDGKEADTTFGKANRATFLADPTKLLPGLANGLIGQKIGSRVLVGVSPADGFAGGAGNAQLGFGKDDALIFLLDLKAAVTPLSGPQGAAVTPAAGLPSVTADAKGAPVITMPKTAPPTKLVIQPLIKGTGAVVKKGQSITAAYVGAVYATGKVFDSSFTTGNKLEQPIGVGGVVPGFDKGIVGQTVGSRVLLVLPPAEGYSSKGNSQAGIKGTDTIVFVVDILAAL